MAYLSLKPPCKKCRQCTAIIYCNVCQLKIDEVQYIIQKWIINIKKFYFIDYLCKYLVLLCSLFCVVNPSDVSFCMMSDIIKPFLFIFANTINWSEYSHNYRVFEGSKLWALCFDKNVPVGARTGVKSPLRMGHFDKYYEKKRIETI